MPDPVVLDEIVVSTAIDASTNETFVVIQFPQLGGRVILLPSDAAKLASSLELAVKSLQAR